MGLKCKITRRNSDNSIELVEDLQGNSSVLYNQALKYTRAQESALDLWAFAYTNMFKEKFGDWQIKEPSLTDVLNTLSSIKAESNPLTNKALFGLFNNMVSEEITDVKELSARVRRAFYKNGIFNINKSDLKKSNLYSDLEIQNILTNPSLQKEVQDLAESLFFTQLNDPSVLKNTSKSSQEQLVLQDTEITVGIGKFKNVIDVNTDQQISEKLQGITDRNEFEEQLFSIPYPFIIRSYQTDSTFADNFFNHYSSLKKISVYEVTDNGLTPKYQNAQVIENTILTEVDSKEVSNAVEFISKIPESAWESVTKDLSKIVIKLEKALTSFNIDVIGLHNMLESKSRAEFVAFLDVVKDFTKGLEQSSVASQDVALFKQAYAIFMETPNQRVQKVFDKVSPNKKDLTLIKVEYPSSDIRMYKQHGLIRTENGYYHKIDKGNTDLYTQVHALMGIDNQILPKQAYYPLGFNENNDFDIEAVLQAPQKEVIANIQRYIQKKTIDLFPFESASDVKVAEEMLLYKAVLNHGEYVDTMNVEEVSNADYLKDEFVSDFYNYFLKEKQKGSFEYENALKYFTFGDFGIDINNSNKNIHQQIYLLLQGSKVFNTFLDYTKVSKNTNFDYFRNVEKSEQQPKTNKELRLEAVNYPNSVKPYKGQYQIKDNVLATVQNLGNFIRVKEGVFELVEENGNISLYKALPANPNRYFLETNVKAPTNSKTSLEVFDNLAVPIVSGVKMDKMYSKSEEIKIDEQFRCS